MFTILNFSIYLLAVLLLPYLLFRLLTEKKHRVVMWQRLGFVPGSVVRARMGKPVVWVHSVSVGEVLAAAPLVGEIRKQFPGYQLLLSATTMTGHEVCVKKVAIPGDLVVYFPVDAPFAVRRMMNLFSPRVILVMETEIWPNLIRMARRRGIKQFLVNGRLSDKSFRRYLSFRWFTKELLRCFCFIGMQTEQGRERMLAIGGPPGVVVVTGSMKYEAALRSVPSEGEVQELRRTLGIPDRRVIVAGSTHRGEEQIMVRVYLELQRKYPDLFLVIAPRHPERFREVEEVLRQSGVPYVLRSKSRGGSGRSRVMVLDTMGELARFYAVATAAFVGKSLGQRGGHNPLEPAACGKPVVFGCGMDNFREVADLLVSHGGAVEVSGFGELVSILDRLLGDEGAAREMGRRARETVELRGGAVERTIAELRVTLGIQGMAAA